MIVTEVANRVRKRASSIAESPPPTTQISWPRKKKPSHVAHVESPCPSRRASPGTASGIARAPDARITASATMSGSGPSWLPSHSENGELASSALQARATRRSAPNRSAWPRIRPMRSGPRIASTNPG